MSYQTTKEHELLREKVREFAERESVTFWYPLMLQTIRIYMPQ